MGDYKPATPTGTQASYPSLKGQVVLITGGGGGIGACAVEQFARQGAKVGFIDIAADVGSELEARLKGDGLDVHFALADLTDVDALRDAVASVRDALGPVTILINNAAHDERHDTMEVTSEYWDRRLAINLKPQFFAAQAVIPHMREAGRGVMICMESTSWMMGQGGMAGYTAAKSGVQGLMRSLADDFGGDNIRVLSVAPGWIMTERQKTMWFKEEDRADVLKGQTVKRLLEPMDIARPLLFFASDEGSACANQTFIVDGGWL